MILVVMRGGWRQVWRLEKAERGEVSSLISPGLYKTVGPVQCPDCPLEAQLTPGRAAPAFLLSVAVRLPRGEDQTRLRECLLRRDSGQSVLR